MAHQRQSGQDALAVNEEGHHDRARNLCKSRRSNDRNKAIVEALAEPHADTLLAEMFDTARYADNVMIAAQLRDLDGADGTGALRRATQTTGPQTRDLRCAVLLALAG